MRTLARLRELPVLNKELPRRLDVLEARMENRLATHDEAIAAILSGIRQLMNPPDPKRGPSDLSPLSRTRADTAWPSLLELPGFCGHARPSGKRNRRAANCPNNPTRGLHDG